MREAQSPLELAVHASYDRFHDALRLISRQIAGIQDGKQKTINITPELVKAIEEGKRQYKDQVLPVLESSMHVTNQMLVGALMGQSVTGYLVRTKGYCQKHKSLDTKEESLRDADVRQLNNPGTAFSLNYQTHCSQCVDVDQQYVPKKTVLEPRERIFIARTGRRARKKEHPSVQVVKSSIKGSSNVFKTVDRMYKKPSVEQMRSQYGNMLDGLKQLSGIWDDHLLLEHLHKSVLDVQRHSIVINVRSHEEYFSKAEEIAHILHHHKDKDHGRLFGLSSVPMTLRRGEDSLQLYKTHIYLDSHRPELLPAVIEVQIISRETEESIRKINAADHDRYVKNKIPQRQSRGEPYQLATQLVANLYNIEPDNLWMHELGRSIEWS